MRVTNLQLCARARAVKVVLWKWRRGYVSQRTTKTLSICLLSSSQVMRHTTPGGSATELKQLFPFLYNFVFFLEFGIPSSRQLTYTVRPRLNVYSDHFIPTKHTYSCFLLPHPQFNTVNCLIASKTNLNGLPQLYYRLRRWVLPRGMVQSSGVWILNYTREHRLLPQVDRASKSYAQIL